jgi:pimeloyl-ACP methyl ester carboxylesterase/DNA-binding winged helix-turn-helix (wHTH) protein
MTCYRFAEYELRTDLFELRKDGELCAMEPQVFTVLAYLVEHHDRVVTKSELIDHVWGDRFISEEALTSRLMAARKVIGDSGQEQRFITTVRGRGYRFIAEVAELPTAGEASSRADTAGSQALPRQEIRYCTSTDGARIAYATSGSGPPLVKVANWLSHLEFDWESPVWRHWMRELSRDNTLIRYDERGCGLSDWNRTEFTLDAWVRDLEAVVDALGLDKFPLLGISQGGPVAIAYASRHPERVTRLVLYGTYARGRKARALSRDAIDEHEALVTLSRFRWGRDDPSFRQLFVAGFIPGASAEQQRWFNDLCRMSTSPENASRFLSAFGDLDVSELLPGVTVPTLVLHALSDQRVPPAEGQWLAASVPGARFVPLLGNNHILLEDEPAWSRFLSEVRDFLAG